MRRAQHARWTPSLVVVAVAILACAAAAHSVAAPRYVATVILPSGAWQAHGSGINAAGEVAGWGEYRPSTATRGFLYSEGVVTVIGTFGGLSSNAYGVNDAGQVVGFSLTDSGTSRAFLHSGGVMRPLGTLGGSRSAAFAINGSGQIVGGSTIALDRAEHAFLYSGDTMRDLGTLGGTHSTAYGMNESGQVVGTALLAGDAAGHAFRYSNGAMVDLGTLGGTHSAALAINDHGHVVGHSQIAGNAVTHAFLYAGGSMRDLDPSGSSDSRAVDINSLGWVVGTQGDRPFLYIDGATHDLNALVVAGLTGARLRDAVAINDRGQIVANGCGIPGTDLTCSAYRLDLITDIAATAVPTFSTWGLVATAMSLAASALLMRRTQRQRSSGRCIACSCHRRSKVSHRP